MCHCWHYRHYTTIGDVSVFDDLQRMQQHGHRAHPTVSVRISPKAHDCLSSFCKMVLCLLDVQGAGAWLERRPQAGCDSP